MNRIVKIVGVFSLLTLFLTTFICAQDKASMKRDFRTICPDTLIGDGMGGFEGGHFAIPNWFPEGGNGYLAVVSRDEWTTPQRFWDCTNDIVAGSVMEKPVVGAGYSRITAVLKYDLPLEVWTIDDFAAGVKVLDGGFFEANLTRKLVLFGEPGSPLNFTCFAWPPGGPIPCGASTYFWHITGEGIAYGTGEGGFYEGQMVLVQVVQNGLSIPPVDPDKNPNWDGWPVEKVTLTPLN